MAGISFYDQTCSFFRQNIDGNMMFKYSLIIIDQKIDEKHQVLTKNEVER
jgi:hypothetical protein